MFNGDFNTTIYDKNIPLLEGPDIHKKYLLGVKVQEYIRKFPSPRGSVGKQYMGLSQKKGDPPKPWIWSFPKKCIKKSKIVRKPLTFYRICTKLCQFTDFEPMNSKNWVPKFSFVQTNPKISTKCVKKYWKIFELNGQ